MDNWINTAYFEWYIVQVLFMYVALDGCFKYGGFLVGLYHYASLYLGISKLLGMYVSIPLSYARYTYVYILLF